MTQSRCEVIGDCTLWLGDCLEILPTLPKVDAVLTDPPYKGMRGKEAITLQGGVAPRRVQTKPIGDPWHATFEWVLPAWNCACRAFFAFCSFHALAELRAAVPGEPVALFSWYTRNAMPSMANVPQFQNEFCWGFRKGPGLSWRQLTTHLDFPRLQVGCFADERVLHTDGTAFHPTQKPVALLRAFLSIGMTSVLDPFMGIGSTGVAAIQCGTQFVGIEIEERYWSMACRRIEAAYKQPDLFLPRMVSVKTPIQPRLFPLHKEVSHG